MGRWEHFGGRLRELRGEKGLTQPQLAELAGLNKDALARLERGERSPTWETVVILAESLGVSTDTFLDAPAPADPSPRGRPRKNVEPEPEKPKRPRGRPKKQASAERRAGSKKPK
jgi:transcriptional regulator with XRE-family HTH domain